MQLMKYNVALRSHPHVSRCFWIRNFLPRPQVAYSNSPVHAPDGIQVSSRTQWSPVVLSLQSMRHRARDSKFALSANFLTLRRHVGLLFGKRLDTILLRHQIRDSPVHTLSDSLRVPLWRADSKISGFAAEFAGCVWIEDVSEKKNLRIQKYPDSWGRGLREYLRFVMVHHFVNSLLVVCFYRVTQA